jgi:hypothetical protein
VADGLSVYSDRVAAGLCPDCSAPHKFGYARCSKCSYRQCRATTKAAARRRRQGSYRLTQSAIESAERRLATKAKRHLKRFRDVLARCQPPRCAETIPAEAYRAYDALVDSVLARAGFEREPLPPGLIREREKAVSREPECVEYLGPWLPPYRGPRVRSG